jgi:hypothetical protein
MSTPTEERMIGDFQPEVPAFTFDPTADVAVGDALILRRAIGDLASHPVGIPPVAIAEARIVADDAVEASFVSRKPTDPIRYPVHVVRTLQRMNQPTIILNSPALQPTAGYDSDIDMSLSPDTLWKPANPEEVKKAKEPIEFDPVVATVAKVALERTAERNLANVDDDQEADNVVRAREALKDMFGEEVAVLPPEPPRDPEPPYVIPGDERHRKLSLTAKLSLLLLFGRR